MEIDNHPIEREEPQPNQNQPPEEEKEQPH